MLSAVCSLSEAAANEGKLSEDFWCGNKTEYAGGGSKSSYVGNDGLAPVVIFIFELLIPDSRKTDGFSAPEISAGSGL